MNLLSLLLLYFISHVTMYMVSALDLQGILDVQDNTTYFTNVTTEMGIAGTSGSVGEGVNRMDAIFAEPESFAVAPDETIYVSTSANLIRAVNMTSNLINTIVGFIPSTGLGGFTPGVLGTSMKYTGGTFKDIQVLSNQNVIVVVGSAPAVLLEWKYSTGTVDYYTGSNILTVQNLDIVMILVDESDNVYMSEFNKVYKLDSTTYAITTIAGTGSPGNTGDGGLATSAQIDVGSMAFDPDGNLVLAADTVRKIDKDTGIISEIVNYHAFSIVYDDLGYLYMIDNLQTCIEVHSPLDNNIYPFAGFCGASGATVDGVAYPEYPGYDVSQVANFNGPATLRFSKDFLSLFAVEFFAGTVRKMEVNKCRVDYYTERGKALIINNVLQCKPCPYGSSTKGLTGQTTCVCDYGKGETGYGDSLKCVDSCSPLVYNPDNRRCEDCNYPYVSDPGEPEECYAVEILFEIVGLSTTMSLLALLYILQLFLSRDHKGNIAYAASFGLFLCSWLPSLAFFNDIVFILTTEFTSVNIFWAVTGIFMVRFVVFFGSLCFKNIRVRFPILHFPEKLVFDEYDNIYKILGSLILALPWVLVNSPFLVPVFLSGAFLSETNLFTIVWIQNIWVKIYMGVENPFKLLHFDVIDVHTLNLNVLTSTLCIAPVTAALQCTTMYLNGNWNSVGMNALTFSCLNFVYGMYRFIRYKYIGQVDLMKIPFEVNFFGVQVHYDAPEWKTIKAGETHFEHNNQVVKALLNFSSLSAFQKMIPELQNYPTGEDEISVLSEELLALEMSLQKELEEVTAERQHVSEILDSIDENIAHPVKKERLHKEDRVNIDDLPTDLSNVMVTENGEE